MTLAITYDFHPLANAFPMMSDDEIKELARSIEADGQIESIKIYEDMIIDGRNRYVACQLAQIEPDYEEIGELVDPAGYVVALNINRRHLTSSQRAHAAAKIKKWAKENGEKVTQAEAAAEMGASVRSTRRAEKVVEHGSEALNEAVSDGHVSVREAEHIVDATHNHEEQDNMMSGPRADSDNRGDEPPEWNEVGPIFKELVRSLNEFKKQVKSHSGPGFEVLGQYQSRIRLDIDNVLATVKTSQPYEVCPYCKGNDLECIACKGAGWVTESTWDNAPRELKNETKRLSNRGSK